MPVFAEDAEKPRAHFSHCAMPHQADDNSGNSSEISREAGGSLALQGFRG